MLTRIITALLILGVCTSAFAVIIETPGNDDIANATETGITNYRKWYPSNDVGIGWLNTATDVDYYHVNLDVSAGLTAVVTPMNQVGGSPDTMFAIYNANGEQVLFDDDSSNDYSSYGSALMFFPNVGGDYYLAVTGSNLGESFAGADHGQIGSYMLTVSSVPLPTLLSPIMMNGEFEPFLYYGTYSDYFGDTLDEARDLYDVIAQQNWDIYDVPSQQAWVMSGGMTLHPDFSDSDFIEVPLWAG